MDNEKVSFYIENTAFTTNYTHENVIQIQSYNKKYTVNYITTSLDNKIIQADDFIIIDENVHKLYPYIIGNNKQGRFTEGDRPGVKRNNDGERSSESFHIFVASEETKTMDSVLEILDKLIALQFTKKNKLIVIGGGITQDVGGFVATIYKRGIDWVLIPTTLLSMADSAIGGKVCINRKHKNIISLFNAPNEIYISDTFLTTLSEDDIISGIGEALKLALIGGKSCYDFFMENWICKNYTNIIKMSACIKRAVIEYDELEKYERKILNYGHTFGHALESTTNYFIPHGIAVLYGMYMINRLFYGNKFQDINTFILDIIPDKYKKIEISYSTFIQNVLNDKKNNGDKICFILLDDLGRTKIVYHRLTEPATPSRIFNARGNVTLPLESPPSGGDLNRQRCNNSTDTLVSGHCNTGFAKQNLVLNGDFVPTNYVGLHKILQSPQQLTTENINDVHCSLEYHIKELLQDLFIVIT